MLKVSRIALVFAAMTFASCVQDNMNEASTPETPGTDLNNNLTTVKLASFKGNANRVTYAGSRAGEAAAVPGKLELVASIANPSKAEGFNFTSEGRYLSATCIYYNEETETYYVTYHMQGNNYNTELETDTAGAIQSFKINEDGEVVLGDGFRAPNPSKEDFDFNNLYFDNTDNRILAVGHNVLDGNRKNTNALVGLFDPIAGTFTYSTVKTNEKEYDAQGKSLGYKDAGDVNAIVRANDLISGYDGKAHGYPTYYLATRKGIAALSAKAETLFQPVQNRDNDLTYFVPTPGSAKYIAQNLVTSSAFDILYLSTEHTGDVEYTTSSEARIATVQTTNQYDIKDSHYFLLDPRNTNGKFSTYYNSTDLDMLEYPTQQTLPAMITPIDGKNVLAGTDIAGEYYAALGTNGLFYKFKENETREERSGVLKFGDSGNAPVNGVAVDNGNGESYHHGCIYVANGSKLTVLYRNSLEEMDSFHEPAFDEDGNDNPASANYIAVRKAPVEESGKIRERTIAVAFGQAGVKIFKITPEERRY